MLDNTKQKRQNQDFITFFTNSYLLTLNIQHYKSSTRAYQDCRTSAELVMLVDDALLTYQRQAALN